MKNMVIDWWKSELKLLQSERHQIIHKRHKSPTKPFRNACAVKGPEKFICAIKRWQLWRGVTNAVVLRLLRSHSARSSLCKCRDCNLKTCIAINRGSSSDERRRRHHHSSDVHDMSGKGRLRVECQELIGISWIWGEIFLIEWDVNETCVAIWFAHFLLFRLIESCFEPLTQIRA